VHNLAARASDHCLIQVCFSNELESERFSYNRGFKFEEAWTHDSECMEVITDAWNDEGLGGAPMREVQRRLTSCQRALTLWSGRKFCNVPKQIKRKTPLLEELKRRENPTLIAEIKTLQAELDELLAREDIQWKQRAKQSWYQSGDRNTKYFHTWANQRRKTNSIRQISDEGGTLWLKKGDISRVFLDYFKKLYTSQGRDRVHEYLANVETRVTDAMNDMLLMPFVEEEVWGALFQKHPLKSPGPDGYNAGFYQKSWNIMCKEVCNAVLHFLNGGEFDRAINSTHNVLIPKVSSPSRVTKFRPISLCSVLYKIFAKVLTNRLKKVLPLVISSEQSAFIPGRLITYNIIVAFRSFAYHGYTEKMKKQLYGPKARYEQSL
jgi:hypothetical protein